MTHPEQSLDLIVVGGGPGGSTVSTLVAQQGHQVLLLERERFPRYQIGESLLPSTVHGICRLLGVTEQIENAGFVRKRGGSFRWGKRPEPWTFDFGEAELLGESQAIYAFQVERSKFDHILLENARRSGVRVEEQCTVTGVLREGERVVGVKYLDLHGREQSARARYVVDASGNQSGLHRHVGERVFSKFFQNIALFAYYEGARRLPPPNSGNILCAAFDQGWFWFIPLSDTLTSVGAVIAREHAATIQEGHEKAMLRFIERCPLISDFLAPARRVTEGTYGQFRVRKDYSYLNDRFWRPGLVLVGDAACFIDPVFSSGVHLATYSALLAARSINSVLAGTLDEATCFQEYERRYRREFGAFYDFLIAFYDMHQDEGSYFWKARKVLQSEETSNEAFIRLVAGGGTAPGEFFARRRRAGELFEQFKDLRTTGQKIDEQLLEEARAHGVDPRTVEANVALESAQITTQALFGDARQQEAPLFQDGLVPSPDGLHWTRPLGAAR
jgi:halogenation protein CepH